MNAIAITVLVLVAIALFAVAAIWLDKCKHNDSLKEDNYILDDFYYSTRGMKDEDSW